MSSPASGLPARNYSWPQFVAGNVAGLRHGAYSARFLAAEVAEMLPMVEEAFPAASPMWHVDYATNRAVLRRLQLEATQAGPVRDGEPRSRLLHDLRAHQRMDLELLREVGMTPASAARMVRDQAQAASSMVDVAAVAAAGRRAAST